MLARYNLKEVFRMEWKSTALINATTIGISLTFIQIANGINQFKDRRNRLKSIRKAKKRKKKDD